MFNKELISIIIPVYNVEAYLKQCVESVLKQQYKNIQIILVDDGSTDGCGELCDMFQKEDDRIEVIHQRNKGLSVARNRGLDAAKGKYIAFIDSDDYVAESFISGLYKMLIQYDAQIACCNYICSKKDINFPRKNKSGVRILSSRMMLKEWHGKYKKVETVVWNKLYRKELFSAGNEIIRFPEGRNHEDVCVTHRLVARSTKTVITEQKLYFYRKRKDSIVGRRITAKEIDDIIYAHQVRLEFFEKISEYAYNRLLVGAQKYRMLYYIRAKGKSELEVQCGRLAKLYKQDQSAVITSSQCTICEKLIFKIFGVFLNMCRG